VSDLGGFADPQSPDTFERSKLRWRSLGHSPHAEVLRFYRDLIAARKRYPCLSNCDKTRTRVDYDEGRRWISVGREDEEGTGALLLCNFSSDAQAVGLELNSAWQLALWSGDRLYGGEAGSVAPARELGGDEGGAHTEVQLAGWSAALYVRT
jgi:maltooligosyltrehalose trehalohydrolase